MLHPLLLVLSSSLGSLAEPVVAPVPLVDDKPVLHEWTGAFSASAIITDGNSETRSANAQFDAQYRREDDRTTVGAFWNYQDDSTGVLQRRTGGKAKYDYFFAPKTYAYGQASAENDHNADLDLRWIAGVGAGEQFIETTDLKFSGELGVSWVEENFGSSPDSEYAAARAAYVWEQNLRKDLSFYHAGEIYPSLEDGDDVYAKLDTRLKLVLTDKMFAQAQWVMDWDNTPAAGKERVDNRYILTVGWSF